MPPAMAPMEQTSPGSPLAKAQGDVGEAPVASPSKRADIERLSDQMEGCEEADSIRRTDLAQQVGAQMAENATHADMAMLQQYVGAAVMAEIWPGEEVIKAEGFTPRSMLSLTNNIRNGCKDMHQEDGGGAVISTGILLLLLAKVEQLLVRKGQKALIEMPDIPGERLVIVGDIHGQLKDLLWIYYRYGLPSQESGNCFLFNGDIADRGNFAVECFALTLGWMLAFPNAVFVNRGNHEDLLVNTSRCGGFYEECVDKYRDHGRIVFEAFGRVFAALPLAFLWGRAPAKIMVVHGGIPRVPSQMLSTLRHMDARAPTVAMRTTSVGEVVQKDCLWSDPQDKHGHDVSTRGASLMRFGPDVTLNFCREEGVGLVVRSHEVPPNGDGYFFQHQDRLCTVFSASNYKGVEHNSGAVLLIRSSDLAAGRLVVRPDTYYAPDLRQACSAEPNLPQELVIELQAVARQIRERERLIGARQIESKTESAIRQHDQDGSDLKKEIVQIMAGLVVARKEELWQAFWGKDVGYRSGGVRTGFVKKHAWKDICEEILGSNVNWETLGNVLGAIELSPPHEGEVDYNRFLHRFHIQLKQDECVSAQWIDHVLNVLFDKLMVLSVEELMGTFDQDKNGRLSISELATAFKRLDAGLSSAQVRALFLTFAVHCDGESAEEIEVEAFLRALVAAVRESSAEKQSLSKHSRARHAWPKWASRYLRLLGKDIWERQQHGFLESFKAADINKDGLLQPDEFVQIMMDLQAKSSLPPSAQLEEPKLMELARLSDFDGSSSVSYMEILMSLQPQDTFLGGHVRFDLYEQICATVWCHHEALLKAFHTMDPEKKMRVNAEVLTRALQQLNTTLAAGHDKKHPLLDFQIEALVAHIQMDEDGCIDYHKFLNAFEVVDCVN